MVIAVTAPLTAVASNLPLSLGLGLGVGTVGAIVAIAVVFALFSVGYIAISKQVVNSAAYYAYIGYGLGRRAGAAAAMVAMVAYNVSVAVAAELVGYFGANLLADRFDVQVPWWVLAVPCIALVFWVCVAGVSITAKVAGWVAVTEFALLIALFVAVVIQRPEGFSLNVFAPSAMVHGNIGLGLVFVFVSFAGYEAAAIYGEEAKGARSNVGRATYLALGLLTAIFVLVTWTLVAAVPDVVALAAEDPGAVLTTVATQYLGSWVGPIILVMIVFSFFAAALSFHAMASRYIFATAREGYIPRFLANVHPVRRTPLAAGIAQTAVCAALMIPFAVAGIDPLTGFLPAIGGMNTLGVMVLLMACSASIIVASVKGKLAASIWAGRVAPALSIAVFAVITFLVVREYDAVTGTDSVVVNFMPLLLVVAGVYGWIVSGRRGSLDLDIEADPAGLPTVDHRQTAD